MSGRVLVLGARGRVGSSLVTELASRGEGVVAASRRSPGAAVGAGASWVRFDFEDEATFGPALRRADRVFMIARPGDERADEFSVPFLDAARRAGVRRVVNLSAMGVDRLEDTALRRIERHLEASGMAWTHLRPNWFMQIFCDHPLVAAVRASGVIRVPAGEATLSFIDARDIAAVAASALTDGRHEGRAYTLTGGEALTHAQVAASIARASKATVRYESLDDERARTALEAAGFPPQRVERLIRFYGMVRAGWCSPVSGDVELALGRPPIGFDTFATDHADAWRSRTRHAAGPGRETVPGPAT